MRVIQAKNLTKVYTRYEKEPGLRGSVKSLFHRIPIEKRALQDFDLTVEEGEFLGLIGPNGAGKTTLVKMFTGIVAPTSGELNVLGYTPNRLENRFKERYAVVMGQKSQLFFELTAADTLLLFKELYGIEEAAYQRNLNYFLDLFGVRGLLNVQVRTLSLGERMKLELIVALLHNPRVLFLDEPTIGLDAVAQKQIRRFLRQVNQDRGTTILLTSHYMEDIRSLCQRCVVVNGGRKLYDGGQAELFERYQTHKRIAASFQAETMFLPPQAENVLERNEYHLSFMVRREQVPAALRALMDHMELSDIAIEEEDIGNVVERIYAEGEVAGRA